MDFKLNFNTDRPIRILQLTDMQIIDGTQRRYPERLDQESGERWNPQHDEENIYAPMRFLIEASMPDLIVITGDMIYGEFDDSGESLKRFVQHLDSYRIPWAVVFGNHDNESKKGISWQCNEIASAKYSVFKRGTVFGNSNYSIGIFRDGKLIRTLLWWIQTAAVQLESSLVSEMISLHGWRTRLQKSVGSTDKYRHLCISMSRQMIFRTRILLLAISLRMTSMKNTSHLIRSVMKCMRRMEILEIRERQFMLAVDRKFYLF